MRQDLDSMTYVASLSGLGTGGPDDNDGQGGRLIAPALTKNYGKQPDNSDTNIGPMLVANGLRRSYGKGTDSDATDTLIAAPLEASDGHHGHSSPRGDGADNLVVGASVRRLTPVECERLQALPDNWTDLGGTPDSRRYAALGDAVTATVAEWIGRRLMEAA